ncbi:MAG: hypothetical protein AAGC85_24670, partial [Bacteroidota bacterium]
VEEGEIGTAHTFSLEELEPIERRDTDSQFREAIHKVLDKIEVLTEEFGEKLEVVRHQWLEEFNNSDYAPNLEEEDKEEYDFAVLAFMRLLWKFHHQSPNIWSTEEVRNYCIDTAPHQLMIADETFENYGDIVINFLRFLDERKYILNAEELIETIEEIKTQIPIEAAKPGNWGPLKRDFFDILNSDENIMDRISDQLLEDGDRLDIPGFGGNYPTLPIRKDPLKNIGRNQRITVKYPDGKVVENVKFKKVEDDVRNGACEIIEL